MLGLVSLTRCLALDSLPRLSCLQARVTSEKSLTALLPCSQAVLWGPQIRMAHNTIRDLRKDFKWKRERPIGPHKHKPPNLAKWGGVQTMNPDYKRVIHYPKDGQYTAKPLRTSKLGGRHPLTGRKVIEGVGGGSKQAARWIDWCRLPADWPRDETVLEERVMLIRYDPLRKAQICLTGHGDKTRWQIATDKMKEGDIIRTHTAIPVNPIRPAEGDSHPLGALPMGSTICLIEAWPGEGAKFACEAEQNAKILRKVGDRVVIKILDSDLEFAIPQEAQCTIGTVSIHYLKAMAIGSPNRMRWLGMRPRSGLWKRKDGRSGRKIKKPPPTIYTMPQGEFMDGAGTPSYRGWKGRTVLLDNLSEGKRGRIKANKRCVPDVPTNTIHYKTEYRANFNGKNPGVQSYKYGIVQPWWNHNVGAPLPTD